MQREIRQTMEILEYPQLRLEALQLCMLNSMMWNNNLLDNHFWRLYHNDGPGAGLWIDGKKEELKADCLYLLPPYCGVRTWCTGTPVQLYLHFECTRLTGKGRGTYSCIRMDNDLCGRIQDLRRRCKEDPYSARLPLLGIAVASQVLTMVPDSVLNEVNSDNRITMACDMIRRNLAKPLNIEYLSVQAGMAKNSFLRKFREVTGSTPYQYILNLRYSLAGRLLKESSMSIDTICDQIGVSDRFHFSRKFKELYGLPPGQYRREWTEHSNQ